jgi:hypothetical protein
MAASRVAIQTDGVPAPGKRTRAPNPEAAQKRGKGKQPNRDEQKQ